MTVEPTFSNITATRLVALDAVDSTNLEAMRRAADGEQGPLWIVARRQTAGRGRSGRNWQMQDGDLAATLLWSTGCPPVALHQISLVTGVAVHAALETLLTGSPHEKQLRLKWPNDILMGHAKLGGILVETSSFDRHTLAAIGIGINIVQAPHIDGRTTACLADVLARPSRADALQAIDGTLLGWLQTWQEGAGFATVREAWLGRSLPPGTAISVRVGDRRVTGSIEGLDTDGALLMRDDGGVVHSFSAGDVSLDAGSP